MSTKPKDGGSAFPRVEAWQANGFGSAANTGYDVTKAVAGMSLRDYFAAKAMAGMTGGGWRPESDEARATLARDAYKVADAMLAQRERET